jgi:1,4-alpha-glucan branching enzyme
MSDVRRLPVARLRDDAWLAPQRGAIERRREHAVHIEARLTGGNMPLADFASGHTYFGLHRTADGWVLREWAPNAARIVLIGTFSDWRESSAYAFERLDAHGTWQLRLPADALRHGGLFRLRMYWQGGEGDRIPAWTRRVVQDPHTLIFNAQVWDPPEPYRWRNPDPKGGMPAVPLIYEAHVGMAQEQERVGTYDEFRRLVLPRIVDAGYNTVQLMAVMEHPYYGSFGYHVSSFFAASSRFGTPEELKTLIDAAHEAGLGVIMDLVHSHAVMNEVEGLSRFDGTPYQFFHDGPRGYHTAWDSRCFDYGKGEVLHFLLSNCRFWLDEYRVDGFRFDGVTSMMYHHRGLGGGFTSYDVYFGPTVDEDAMAYLTLANKVIHTVRPHAITIAEDVSGMPGLGAPIADGGCGFDFRLAMGVPDCWFKLVNDIPDEQWNMEWLWRELTNRRGDERVISYAESHDQALVGGKSLIFEMIDADMYDGMQIGSNRLTVDRGVALHKMIRLITLASAPHGYLNFMGNEFGHPEWIDFPREGNQWSYHHAKRQWSLRDDQTLLFKPLGDFDQAMMAMVRERRTLERAMPRMLRRVDNDKFMAFERSGLFFFFNFHPERSLADYPLEVPPGEYGWVLDTDEKRFGGQGRIAADHKYPATPVVDGNVQRHFIRIYLPARTALVIEGPIPAGA